MSSTSTPLTPNSDLPPLSSPEIQAVTSFRQLSSSLQTDPSTLLNFFTSPSILPHLLSPQHHTLWTCGSCGRSSAHLSGSYLRHLRGPLTPLRVMAERVGSSVSALSEIERGVKRPGEAVEEGYLREWERRRVRTEGSGRSEGSDGDEGGES